MRSQAIAVSLEVEVTTAAVAAKAKQAAKITFFIKVSFLGVEAIMRRKQFLSAASVTCYIASNVPRQAQYCYLLIFQGKRELTRGVMVFNHSLTI